MADETRQSSAATTRRAQPARKRTPQRRVLGLTIALHPDPRRIGDVARLAVQGGKGVHISRLEPAFTDPITQRSANLGDPFLSRRPITLTPTRGGAVRVDREPDRMEVSIDGVPVQATSAGTVVSSDQIDAGAVIELSDRIVLILHRTAAAPSGPEQKLGLIGESEAIRRLRAEIALVCPHDVPTLIRGESGTGKELVARAIAEGGRRGDFPLVSVNMGAISPSTAVSQLFGHVRGAFTGAATDHPGYFGRANRGTVFLDEIGEASAELQVMLLRALETGEIQPVGARQPRRVDVRVLAATDADLEQAARDGRFRAPLLHRLSGFQVDVPPLRERREDIGRLLVHFMREQLGGALDAHQDDETPWLPSALGVRLCRYAWPGNVRQLRNVARRLAIEAGAGPIPEELGALDRLLAEEPETAPSSALEPSGADSPRRPADIDEDALIRVLKENRWRLGATAKALGIARSSLYLLIDQCPRIRKAGDLGADEIERASEDCGGNVDAMADALEVSRPGLLRRMKQLGLAGT